MKTKLYSKDIPFNDEEGWKDVLDRYNSNPIRSLYPVLGNGLYHRCSIESCSSILDTEYLMPNRGRFRTTYDQSKSNYGYINGWICLFDFSEQIFNIAITIDSWGRFFREFSPTIIFEFNRKNLNKLIPPQYHLDLAKHEQKFCIPYVEAWYPESLDISLIDKYIVVLPDSDPVDFFTIKTQEILEHIHGYPKCNFCSAFCELLGAKHKSFISENALT